ncbi:ProQ/FinO family protein, partial [Patescibacteria group bacterium]|nr:ProQ/FinO family protein [Patescibacteria group bacterium]
MGEGKDGKVVNLFTRKPVVQSAAETQKTDSAAPEAPEIAGDDFDFFIKNRSRLSEVAERANEIEKTIGTLQGYARSERNIGIRAEGLKAASLPDLFESLLTSHAGMWTQKPSYYLAVIAEFSKRIDAFSRRARTDGGPGSAVTSEEMLVGDTLFVLHNSSRAIEACREIDVITVYVMDECGI